MTVNKAFLHNFSIELNVNFLKKKKVQISKKIPNYKMFFSFLINQNLVAVGTHIK
jgi:dynactin complex subunit